VIRSPFHAPATTLTSSGLPKQNVAGSNPVSRSISPFGIPTSLRDRVARVLLRSG
jgi:hypothetical protein